MTRVRLFVSLFQRKRLRFLSNAVSVNFLGFYINKNAFRTKLNKLNKKKLFLSFNFISVYIEMYV